MRLNNLAGERFGRWLVLRRHGDARPVRWECQCECGSVGIVTGCNLRTGHSKSCGCLKREVSRRVAAGWTKTHGKSKSRTFRIWKNAIYRCHTESCPQFNRYGGRGIKVCQQWRDSFECFLIDMGEPPSPNHTLDRIDNDGDYCPANCRWATQGQQLRNRGGYNVYLEHDGHRLTVSEWAERLGIHHGTLRKRIQMGWSAEKTLTTRVRERP